MTSATTIILVLYFIQGSLGHGVQQGRGAVVGVTGGHAVDIEHAPFMAAVMEVDAVSGYTDLWCAGSIVHDQFVLTTAECIDVGKKYIVRVGSTRYGHGAKRYRVKKSIIHESFSNDTNNVALLKLSKPVTFGPRVSLINLADASVNIPVGLAANVTGWGETKYVYWSRELRQAPVTVSPPGDCNNYYDIKLTDNQLCVNNIGTGACLFDEGAPLTAGGVQIGIYSYGTVCSGERNVYEKVAPYLQWIRHNIEQNL